jgi:hypothetical protein
VPRCHSVDLIG